MTNKLLITHPRNKYPKKYFTLNIWYGSKCIGYIEYTLTKDHVRTVHHFCNGTYIKLLPLLTEETHVINKTTEEILAVMQTYNHLF